MDSSGSRGLFIVSIDVTLFPVVVCWTIPLFVLLLCFVQVTLGGDTPTTSHVKDVESPELALTMMSFGVTVTLGGPERHCFKVTTALQNLLLSLHSRCTVKCAGNNNDPIFR